MTIPQTYDSLQKAIYPKTEFVDTLVDILKMREDEDMEWSQVGLKAPTRDTVMNWVTGKTKPTNPLYLKALSVGLDIPIDKLFD